MDDEDRATMGEMLKIMVGMESQLVILRETVALITAVQFQRESDPDATLRQLSNMVSAKITNTTGKRPSQESEGPLLSEIDAFISKVRGLMRPLA